jgi:hypothetical protein
MTSQSKFVPANPSVRKNTVMPDQRDVATEISRKIAPDLNIAKHISKIASSVEPLYNRIDASADTVEIVSGATRAARQSRDAAYATKAAVRHMNEMAQSGRDVARMKREILIMEKIIAHRGSQKAAYLLPKMKTGLLVAEAGWQAERTLWNSYRRIAEEYKGVKASAFGKRALALEKTLSASANGRQILDFGKVVNRAVGALDKGLMAVGAGIALIKGVDEAPAKTVGGKALTGALAGGASMMMNVNPAVGLTDFAVSSTVGEDYSLSKFYEGTAHNVGVLTETLFTGDSAALGAAHQRSMNGDNGRFIQAYAMIGEKISKNSVVDNIITHAAEVCTGVPEYFRTSTKWWGTSGEQSVNTDEQAAPE